METEYITEKSFKKKKNREWKGMILTRKNTISTTLSLVQNTEGGKNKEWKRSKREKSEERRS